MEDSRKKFVSEADRDIIYSKTVKAGKRIYYIDVKKSRNEDMYIAITESKKIIQGESQQNVSFEKHKIFLYKEDFRKFLGSLADTIKYIEDRQGVSVPPAPSERQSESSEEDKKQEIHFDIDF